MRRRVRIITIDLEDRALESVADVIEDQTNDVLQKLECESCTIVSVSPVPMATLFTIPGDPSATRDYSFIERGVMVMVTYDQPHNGDPTK